MPIESIILAYVSTYIFSHNYLLVHLCPRNGSASFNSFSPPGATFPSVPGHRACRAPNIWPKLERAIYFAHLPRPPPFPANTSCIHLLSSLSMAALSSSPPSPPSLSPTTLVLPKSNQQLKKISYANMRRCAGNGGARGAARGKGKRPAGARTAERGAYTPQEAVTPSPARQLTRLARRDLRGGNDENGARCRPPQSSSARQPPFCNPAPHLLCASAPLSPPASASKILACCRRERG
ncbi:hypothetical protein BS78_K285600 [Paspalum vaginatum]|uniref:Uncharacterized protein n=1 Tax=Paspalum vaginatum TaxID=158149 RepID=A0A9W7XAR0_9POAL|nr:hypothetical protein BS78_K285600 [Paspalum vaginatum]